MSNNNANALYYAAKEGNLDKVEFLINKGAKIDTRTKNGNSALDIASEKGHYFIVESLLRHEKKQGSINIDSLNAALARAVLGGHHNIVKLLLHEGASLEKRPLQSFNVLHAAARAGDVFMLETLLNAPGGKKWIDKKHIKDGVEKTPLYYATENDHRAAVELLLHYGADGNASLHIAVENGNLEIIKLLLKSARSEFTDKAKKQVTKNWLDKDYTNLLEIRETYLAVEKKINNFTLEMMELSSYFNELRETIDLQGVHSKMKRVEVIEEFIKNAQNVVHAKTDNIEVNNGARREKLVTQSEAILAKLSEELLQDIQEVRVSAQRVIEALHSGPFNKKQL